MNLSFLIIIADSKTSEIIEEILLLRLQTFQRIQRNRQSRIRVKLSRRAGKRSDEILEEDEPNGIHHHVMHLGAHHKMEQPQSSSTPGNYLPISAFPSLSYYDGNQG